MNDTQTVDMRTGAVTASRTYRPVRTYYSGTRSERKHTGISFRQQKRRRSAVLRTMKKFVKEMVLSCKP